MAGVVLIAAGGLARETIGALRAVDATRPRVVLDDDPARWGTDLGDARVVGGLEDVKRYEDHAVVVCAGSGALRRRLVERLLGLGVTPDRFESVIHPRADVSDCCTIGLGSILLAGVVLTADVYLGRHVVVMPNVTLTHDDVLEDFVTVAAGASIAGGVRVGEASYIGSNASVRENLSIGADAVLGMGAALVGDLPRAETWAGVPARALDGAGGTP
jgi:sugar O-acyltransferase (sialic acid O-acetyltransferase NeuD family)